MPGGVSDPTSATPAACTERSEPRCTTTIAPGGPLAWPPARPTPGRAPPRDRARRVDGDEARRGEDRSLAPAAQVPSLDGVREIVVFCGSAHPELARRICAHVGVPLCPTRIDRFSNDCLQVQLQENCRQRDVYIVQPLVPPTQEHLMELLLMIDAARGASAASITAVIPFYSYARSDKKDASRISIGGRLVADLLVAAGARRVITMALHAPQVHGFFAVPV